MKQRPKSEGTLQGEDACQNLGTMLMPRKNWSELWKENGWMHRKGWPAREQDEVADDRLAAVDEQKYEQEDGAAKDVPLRKGHATGFGHRSVWKYDGWSGFTNRGDSERVSQTRGARAACEVATDVSQEQHACQDATSREHERFRQLRRKANTEELLSVPALKRYSAGKQTQWFFGERSCTGVPICSRKRTKSVPFWLTTSTSPDVPLMRPRWILENVSEGQRGKLFGFLGRQGAEEERQCTFRCEDGSNLPRVPWSWW